MGEYALGQSVPRSEDPRLLRGGGRYIDDMKLRNMVYGQVLRSPHANAKILKLDVEQAKKAPGVLLVLLHDDWANSGMGGVPTNTAQKRRDGSPMYSAPIPVLCKDQVRRVGDYVAFIVAETQAQAIDAAELIEVDYDPLPSVTDTVGAAEPGAPLVYEDCPDNICFVREVGDKEKTDAAFANAAHVSEHRFVINRVSANSMETRGCIADYNKSDDHYTLYTTLQGAHPYRSKLANRVLKVPESHVRVVAGDVGGSFGMKSQIYNENILVLLASKMLGQPVKWISTRTEALMSDGHGRDHIVDMALAVDKDGMFLGLRGKTIINMGAYISESTPNPGFNNLGSAAGVYLLAAAHVDVTGVFTNSNWTCPYRGAGRPEAAFMIERIIDVAAHDLDIDPAELRRRNTIPPEAMPYKTALTFTYDCGEFEKNLDMALEQSDYKNFEQRRAEAKTRGKLRGIGIANAIESAAGPGIEAAEVRFDRSGTATILVGSCTQGQGHETVFKQIVCDQLGLQPEEVGYVWGDTDKVAFGHGTGGSRTGPHGGAAVNMATGKIIEKARLIAAHMMEASPDDLEFKEGTFTIAGTDKKMTIKEIAKAASAPANMPEGVEPSLIANAIYTAKQRNYPNGCHICELEIDEETGEVDVLNYNVVDDVGTVMNPMLLRGQIQGGVAQGMGQVLMEDVTYDPQSGQLIAASFIDYCMPRAQDFSYIWVETNPVPTKVNPLGIKGAGEAGNVGALPCVNNAVVNALKPLGVRHVDMPTTPQRLWRTIQAAKAGKAA